MAKSYPTGAIPHGAIPEGAVPGALLELTPPDTVLTRAQAEAAEVHLAIFGEAVQYTPAGGQAVTITAVVDRRGPQIQDTPRRHHRPVTIAVKPDATEGIDPDAFTERDTVTVHTTRGGSDEVTLRLVRRTFSDAGLDTYET